MPTSRSTERVVTRTRATPETTTLEQTLARLGITPDQLQGLARRAMTTELGLRNIWLPPSDFDELHSELVEIAIGLAQNHDPTKGTLSYPTRAYRIMRLRTISHIRRRIRHAQRMSDTAAPDVETDIDFADLIATTDRIDRWQAAADSLGFDVTSWILTALDEAADAATKDAA